jgi:septation ring formation regulator EzrA
MINDLLKRYEQHSRNLRQLQTDRDRAEGRLDALKNDLKDMGIKSVRDAERVLARNADRMRKLDSQISDLMNEADRIVADVERGSE